MIDYKIGDEIFVNSLNQNAIITNFISSSSGGGILCEIKTEDGKVLKASSNEFSKIEKNYKDKLINNPNIDENYILKLSEELSQNEIVNLLSDSKVIENLNGNFIYLLLEKLKNNYLFKCLTNPLIIDKLSGSKLSYLFVNLESQYILSLLIRPYIFSKIDSYDYAHLFSAVTLKPHEIICLIKDKERLSKLKGYPLEILIQDLTKKEVIYILNDNNMIDILESRDIKNLLLELTDEEINLKLKDQTIIDKLSGDDLSSLLVILDKDTIKRKIGNVKIFNKLNGESLIKVLCEFETDYVLNLLDSNIILNKLAENSMQYINLVNNKQILKDVILKYNNLSILFQINFDLFKEPIISSLDKNIFEKLCAYPTISSKIVNLYNQDKKLWECFKNMFDVIKGQHFNTEINFDLLTLRFIKSLNNENSQIVNLVRKENNLTKEDYLNLAYISIFDKENLEDNVIEAPLRDIDDLRKCEQIRQEECDIRFKIAKDENQIEQAKNAYFNKYFRISLKKAKELIEKYGYSLDKMEMTDDVTKMNIQYLESIKKVLQIKDIDSLEKIYIESKNDMFKPDELVCLKQSIPQMFAKDMINHLYQINEDNLINLEGAPKDIKIYEPEKFNILLHSTCAFGSATLTNNNYSDTWNQSDKIKNHGICCSLISDTYLGIPPLAAAGVLLGFDSFSPKALSASAPYDIFSKNDLYEISQDLPSMYMKAEDIINSTRATHNEQTIERYEMRPNISESKLRPSYVIITDEMSEKKRKNAFKCASEMNLPILYIDTKKIMKKNSNLIDNEILKLNQIEDENARIKLLEKIINIHENSSAGIMINKPEIKEDMFPPERIETLLAKEIKRIINFYTLGNIEEFEAGIKLLDILQKEKDKFKRGKREYQMPMDINFNSYIEALSKLLSNQDKNILLNDNNEDDINKRRRHI